MDAAVLAQELIRWHGLSGWGFRWDRAKTRLGVCRFGPRVIGLSLPLASTCGPGEVLEALLHEVAHALAGASAGHGPVWGEVVTGIGGRARRCAATGALPGPWVGTCPRGHQVTRHRRPVRVGTCPTCSSRFDLAHLLEWTLRGQVVPMGDAYDAELGILELRAERGAHVRPGPQVGGRTAPGPQAGGPADLG